MTLRIRRAGTLVVLAILAALSTSDCQTRDAAAAPAAACPGGEAPWPEWVLGHWVWEDESTQDSALALVRGYLDRGIAVRAVVLDSPWETGYNTFEFDPARYPRPREMIEEFHRLGVRVVLWITPMINVDSPDYAWAKKRGYLLDPGEPVRWWKGQGSFIDYDDPAARAWWHERMDRALDLGIDGWKCDETVAYVPKGSVLLGKRGPVDPVHYQETYYRDFFDRTRARLGRDRVILARAVDTMPFPSGRTIYAPRDVNFAAWAGDQTPDFAGLKAALTNVLLSAERGYVHVGSDVGGYFGKGPRDPELLVRWAQLGAWLPLFENGGMGEHRPWAYGEPTLSIYREYAAVHESLAPYLYSEGARLYRAGRSLVTPLEGTRGPYLLGEAFFVVPVTEPGGRVTVSLPPGTWYDFRSGETRAGTFERKVGLEDYPVYARAGAIVPLDDPAAPFDGPAYTIAIWVGRSSRFDLCRDGSMARIAYYDELGMIEMEATIRPAAFRLIGIAPPASVEADGKRLTRVSDLATLRAAESGWTFVSGSGLWIKPSRWNAAERVVRVIRAPAAGPTRSGKESSGSMEERSPTEGPTGR